MKKFIIRALLFSITIVISLLLYVALRICIWQKDVRDSMIFEPWQSILFIGDSHIGCTIVEAQEYHNKLIWESSMPQQFTLMRIRDMERCGALRTVKGIILDFGLQSIGQQRRKRMQEFFWRMSPITWRYKSLLPLSWFDCLEYIASNVGNWRVHIIEEIPTSNTSILDQPEEVREKDYIETSDTHFKWIDYPEEMCDEWEQSLKDAIKEIKQICDRNGVAVVFFTAPLTSYYRDGIPVDVELKLQDFVEYIKSQGIPYYDLRDWGEDKVFRDCFHFTFDGAKEFTRRFYDEIIMRDMPYLMSIEDTRTSSN